MSPEKRQDEYSISESRILDRIISAHQNVWELADYYCESYGSAEESFEFFYVLNKSYTSITVEEIISARNPGQDFFCSTSDKDYCFPFTRVYRFNDIENYVRIVFLKMMQFNSNFCKCNYCYRFFIPKTKKLTRFCDRVNPESGKTCKKIAPTAYRNDDISSNKILKQYDLASRRNYKRMCRGEERLSKSSGDKDIDPQTYFDWRDRVLKTIRLWKDKQISDEEFLNFVNELDLRSDLNDTKKPFQTALRF